MPWFWDLVAMSSQIPLSLPNLTNLLTAIQSDPSQKSDKSESPCMAPRASAIEEQGLSEAVAARIEAPQRGSIRSVYEASGPFLQSDVSSVLILEILKCGGSSPPCPENVGAWSIKMGTCTSAKEGLISEALVCPYRC